MEVLVSSHTPLKVLLAIALVTVAVLAGALYRISSPGGPASPETNPQGAVKRNGFHCAMHPTMISDKPEACPICQMRMVPDDDEGQGSGEAQPAGERKVVYRSTMNPGEISDHPGKDSMGMEMVAEEVEGDSPEGPEVQGRVRVRISSEKRQLIGVRTAVVERKSLTKTIRTVGRVTFD